MLKSSMKLVSPTIFTADESENIPLVTFRALKQLAQSPWVDADYLVSQLISPEYKKVRCHGKTITASNPHTKLMFTWLFCILGSGIQTITKGINQSRKKDKIQIFEPDDVNTRHVFPYKAILTEDGNSLSLIYITNFPNKHFFSLPVKAHCSILTDIAIGANASLQQHCPSGPLEQINLGGVYRPDNLLKGRTDLVVRLFKHSANICIDSFLIKLLQNHRFNVLIATEGFPPKEKPMPEHSILVMNLHTVIKDNHGHWNYHHNWQSYKDSKPLDMEAMDPVYDEQPHFMDRVYDENIYRNHGDSTAFYRVWEKNRRVRTCLIGENETVLKALSLLKSTLRVTYTPEQYVGFFRKAQPLDTWPLDLCYLVASYLNQTVELNTTPVPRPWW
jgi:hypothetical protein